VPVGIALPGLSYGGIRKIALEVTSHPFVINP
jgi:hypothetical protein